MAESTSQPKRQRPKQNIDRISALPDSILFYILSFLPTKTVVRTSVLSHRWQHLWEHLQVLDFSDDSHEFFDEGGKLFKRFIIFVNSVLALRKARDICAFRLSCGHSDSDPFHANSVATWVRAAIGPHLEEFNLTLFSSDGRGFVVPHSLFSCTKLVTLALCGGMHVQPRQPSSVRLLSLKMLHLDIDSVDFVNVILAGCPVLETLCLSFAPRQLVKVRVPSTLKMLKFAVENDVETVLEIHAPGLEYLNITHCANHFTYTVGNNLNSVMEVYLNVHATEEPVDALLRLLTSICNTKTLALRRLTTKWLLRSPFLDFPNFQHLIHLELTLPWFDSSLLVRLLKKCYSLQDLIIQIEKELPPISQTWTQPTSVPACLASHLSFFHYTGYQGCQDELGFVGYIIQKGLVLNRVIIYADTLMEIQRKYYILRELFAIPRGSVLCQANFC